jgi:tRNA (guanine37-N1)-methyltransferase
MVLCPSVMRDALAALPRAEPKRALHFSPAAPPLTHAKAVELAEYSQLVLVCTRYEGADQRAIDLYIDEEISVGEAVVSGGELPALFLIDAVCRWLPGVLGNDESAAQDSFANGLLDHPHYTRPEVFEGAPVPQALMSGDHRAIALWRLRESMARTKRLRPDLWAAFLNERLKGLPPAEQWQTWQVENLDDWGKEKPRGWKGFS